MYSVILIFDGLIQECSLYQDCVPLSEHQATVTADLVEGLLGSPPTISALTTIVEYLLLLHPAEQTYCPTSSVGYSCYFLLSTRDPNVDVFQPRDWKLPEGYETYAPESSVPQPMNANRLGSALRDVIVKWSDGKEEIENEIITNAQVNSSIQECQLKFILNCILCLDNYDVFTDRQ